MKQILQRFQDEVLNTGPEATLPSNLNDYWLTEIQQTLERLFEDMENPEETENGDNMSLPLAAIMHILFAKNSDKEIKASMEEIFKHFEDYRIELALEEIRRKTDVKAEPATITTIFTNRDVTFSQL